MQARVRIGGLVAALAAVTAVAACSGEPNWVRPSTSPVGVASSGRPAGPAVTTAPVSPSSAAVVSPSTASPSAATAPASPSPDASPTTIRIGDATPAPAWLGTRPLPVVADGLAGPQKTPPDLFPRSIITVDELPPPADGAFRSSITAVPADVLARSTWSADCPVPSAQLRYVTVTFRGFDGRAHTGELLVHQQAAAAMVSVFSRLFAAGFPIERMRITTKTELDAAPTGDGNTTGAFTCRRIPGQTTWSQHALGLAIDVNPFQNPYRKGDVVLPELATAYLDRSHARPGEILPDGPVVKAFTAVGWKWGGNYRSLKDFMHFSLTGG